MFSSFQMVIGSTLLVQPAALMPSHAKQSGGFLAIIKVSETPCDVLIRGKAGEVLPELVEQIGNVGYNSTDPIC